uniref:Uncharacterized protein n=1 Tax=Solanum lycopersicum TaxID=4081 RepID=A0A3Q7HA86_SOLLC
MLNFTFKSSLMLYLLQEGSKKILLDKKVFKMFSKMEKLNWKAISYHGTYIFNLDL